MSENAVIPFGKYKGTPIAEVVASDPGYIEWAMAQENVREKNRLYRRKYNSRDTYRT